jgi:hypothetical protein
MKTLEALIDIASYSTSIPALNAVRRIGRRQGPEALDALVLLLDIPGVVGDAVAEEIIERGCLVEEAMRRCIDSDDSLLIARGRYVLHMLGIERLAATAEFPFVSCFTVAA